MRICNDHWTKIRERIKALGIDHLGAQDSEQAAAEIEADIRGTAKPEDYDPLMSVNWMIVSRALDLGGLALLYANTDGTAQCPICEAWKHKDDNAPQGYPPIELDVFEHYWLDGPTDATYRECIKRGLVKAN